MEYMIELCGQKTLDYQTHRDTPRYEFDTIGKRRKALYDAADISGFELEKYNGDERQLLEQVVEGVLKRVKRKLHVSKYPIALDEKVKILKGKSYFFRKARVIGIVGWGGVGKTTLAKEIFNRQISKLQSMLFFI